MPSVGLEFSEKRTKYRGTTFVLREVDAATFDKCMERATEKNFEDDPAGVETINQKILFRQLLLASLVEPKLTSNDINKMGMRLVQQLERDARELHFDVEPAQPADDDKDDDGGNGVGSATGR